MRTFVWLPKETVKMEKPEQEWVKSTLRGLGMKSWLEGRVKEMRILEQGWKFFSFGCVCLFV